MRCHNKKYPNYWNCKHCQTTFKNKTGHIRFFCSRKCYWNSMKGKINPGAFESGAKHWNYSGIRVDRNGTTFNYPMYRAIRDKCQSKCNICGFQFPNEPIYKIRGIMSFDHIIPIALGGEHTVENGQLLCRTCNREKTHTDLKQIHQL